MKLFDKKVSLVKAVAVMFVVSSGVYSLGYKIAMDKFNSLVSFSQEKQKMYGDLSEIDYSIRNEYIGQVDEQKILDSLYRGYISGVDDCKFLDKNQYDEYKKENENIPAEVSWDEIEGVGYLRCKSLGKGSADMLIDKLEDFLLNGTNNIVLDLRISENGNIDEVFKILQYIAPSGDIIYTVDKNGKKEVVCKSNGEGINCKMSILTSKNCSKYAEILALGLKHSLNAKIVGENTKGNFEREKVTLISENSVIIFPDAKYITSTEDLDKKGLSPDKFEELSEENSLLLKEEKLPYAEDNQLQSAIDSFKE